MLIFTRKTPQNYHALTEFSFSSRPLSFLRTTAYDYSITTTITITSNNQVSSYNPIKTAFLSHFSLTIFVLISYSLDTQVILTLVLLDVQYSQKAIFSFEKDLIGQNHSSTGSHCLRKRSPIQTGGQEFPLPQSTTTFIFIFILLLLTTFLSPLLSLFLLLS